MALFEISGFFFYIINMGPSLGLLLDTVVVLCLSDPVAFGLQDQPLPMLQQIKDGVDDGMGQLIALVKESICK